MNHTLYIIIKVFRILLLFLLYPAFVFLLLILPLVAGSVYFATSENNIKKALADSEIYINSIDIIIDIASNSSQLQGSEQLDSSVINYLADNAIDKAKVAEWLQSQTETVIDKTFAYLRTGESFIVDVDSSDILQDIIVPTLSNFEDTMDLIDTLPECNDSIDINNLSNISDLNCIPAELKDISVDEYSELLDEVPFINEDNEDTELIIRTFSSDQLQFDRQTQRIVQKSMRLMPYAGLIAYVILIVFILVIGVLLYENFVGLKFAAWTTIVISAIGIIFSALYQFLPKDYIHNISINVTNRFYNYESVGDSLAKLLIASATQVANQLMLIYGSLLITGIIIIVAVSVYLKRRHAYDKF